ncbi:MAG TPA: PilZ domain-containing protein [Polyangia bacterium]|nr:PilZ domain-containing protein [Polyangia bacterium]
MFVREHTRYPVELAVRMKCATWADYLELHTSNLSRGGLFVPSVMSAPVGTEIAIELALPNGATVKLRGEIVHVAEKSGEQPAGMGVMFMAMDDAAKRALEEALRLANANAPKPASPPPVKSAAPTPVKSAPPMPAKAAPPMPAKVAPPTPARSAPPPPAKAAPPPPPIKAAPLPPSPLKAAPKAAPPPIKAAPAPIKAAPAPIKAAPPPPAKVDPKLPAPLPPPPTADGWDLPAPAAPPPEARAPKFADAVEQALLDELARRLDLQPHEQLGVAIDADDNAITEAFQRLKERYAPSIFARYGASTTQIVRNVNDAIDAAYRRLLDPNQRRALVIAAHQPRARELTPDELEQKRRGEEARQALRTGIERRVEEACAHRDMGRIDDAIRTFEHVLQLDRKHEFAKAELVRLRDLKTKRKR